ncbi:nicotinamidase-related amidase [Conyzicola lurida]|uniref:Nicotinamidase-related amidase n=1 Tax=Conyzicola lurida TaxID=1172621 RepID=A0A841APK4_9MICO|nr:isochorismatase family cysteine hydrolase [Conyzicola lurida]MBB5843485.1 nicotinamidase-related amidase [Conyzicola lurida]
MTWPTELAALESLPGALLVVDVQRSFADPAYLGGYGLDVAASASIVDAIATISALVDSARAVGVPVVWIELGSEPDRVWRSSGWLRGATLDAAMSPDEPCIVGTPGAEWYGVEPAAGETRVVKRVYSGFFETGLGATLRAAGVEWVAVTGLTSECCVAATATDAVQLDFPVVIPRDATAAYDVRINENALEQLGLNVGQIVDSSELTTLFATSAPASAAANEALSGKHVHA